MQKRLKTFVICIAIPLIVGGVSGFITRGSMQTFEKLNKPPFTPPGAVFPVVWTLLYILMGISSYLVLSSGKAQDEITNALIVYALSLAINFFWSLFFFNMGWYLFSFLWLLLLWISISITIRLFYQLSKPAALLMIPYLLWVTFAGYLNLAIYLINK